jgi:plastocyanin
MKKLLTILAVAALLAALAVTGAGVATGAKLHAAGKTKTVTVGDDFYSPKKITIKKGTTIKWVWQNGQTDNTHTVTDEKGRFTSKETDTGTYKHKFKKAGKFNIICAVHEDMTMKVRVKKPS